MNEKIGRMLGKTPVKIEGGERWDKKMRFFFEDGTECVFYHCQDCCESVEIEEVFGNLADLLGSPLLIAEERESGEEGKLPGYHESYTWTFYEFATVKGSVTVRWLGESNGYYSESVDFRWGKERE